MSCVYSKFHECTQIHAVVDVVDGNNKPTVPSRGQAAYTEWKGPQQKRFVKAEVQGEDPSCDTSEAEIEVADAADMNRVEESICFSSELCRPVIQRQIQLKAAAVLTAAESAKRRRRRRNRRSLICDRTS